METLKYERAILVYKGLITSSAKASILHLFETTQHSIEEFSLEELQINITEHELVPKHTILSTQ